MRRGKLWIAVLLAVLMVVALLPTTGVSVTFAVYEGEEASDALWAEINALRTDLEGKRATNTQIINAVYAYVADSSYTEPDTITWRGSDRFIWWTKDGVANMYMANPLTREEGNTGEIDLSDFPAAATRAVPADGYYPAAKNVHIFVPCNGYDSTFDDYDYAVFGTAVSNYNSGTSTSILGTNVTVAAIASALQTDAVVFFNTHGLTDYQNGSDCVSQANSSYIVLTSGTGLTTADYASVTGAHGTYAHAFHTTTTMTYNDTASTVSIYCVDGTAIANHMTAGAPCNAAWFASCLSMATTGLSAPLRGKGVGLIYGYSQSVTFWGDYVYANYFWASMVYNHSEATAGAAYMKTKAGSWDPAFAGVISGTTSYTEAQAVANYVAFPVFVTVEDAHPSNPDAVQTVTSHWMLCYHTYANVVTVPTCTAAGYTTRTCSHCGRSYTLNPTAALGHSYADATCTLPQTCTRCGATTGSALGHNYAAATCTEPQTCTRCGATTGSALGHNIQYTSNGDGTHNAACSRCGLATVDHEYCTYVNGVCTLCHAADCRPLLISNATEGTQYTYTNGLLQIIQAGTYTISMRSGVTVTADRIDVQPMVAGTVNLTLQNVSITTSIDSALELSGVVNLTLSGTNTFDCALRNPAALHTVNGSNVTIQAKTNDNDKLTILMRDPSAQNMSCGAGIGADNGDDNSAFLTINSGTVSVSILDKGYGAAIGGSNYSTGDANNRGMTICINGGSVVAEAYGANGIGVGFNNKATGTTLTINGGSVVARATSRSALYAAPTISADIAYTAVGSANRDGSSSVPYAASSNGSYHYFSLATTCVHSYTAFVTTAATCITEGVRTYTCTKCGYTKTEVIPTTGHNPVPYSAVAPTCTTTGRTGGTYCSVCNAQLTAPTVIAALGHDYVYVSNRNGTHDYVCSRCGDVAIDNEPCTYDSDGVCIYCHAAKGLKGDVNCDGSITAADATLLMRYLVGLDTMSAQGYLNAKVTPDDAVTSADAAQILRYTVGLITAL